MSVFDSVKINYSVNVYSKEGHVLPRATVWFTDMFFMDLYGTEDEDISGFGCKHNTC